MFPTIVLAVVLAGQTPGTCKVSHFHLHAEHICEVDLDHPTNWYALCEYYILLSPRIFWQHGINREGGDFPQYNPAPHFNGTAADCEALCTKVEGCWLYVFEGKLEKLPMLLYSCTGVKLPLQRVVTAMVGWKCLVRMNFNQCTSLNPILTLFLYPRC